MYGISYVLTYRQQWSGIRVWKCTIYHMSRQQHKLLSKCTVYCTLQHLCHGFIIHAMWIWYAIFFMLKYIMYLTCLRLYVMHFNSWNRQTSVSLMKHTVFSFHILGALSKPIKMIANTQWHLHTTCYNIDTPGILVLQKLSPSFANTAVWKTKTNNVNWKRELGAHPSRTNLLNNRTWTGCTSRSHRTVQFQKKLRFKRFKHRSTVRNDCPRTGSMHDNPAMTICCYSICLLVVNICSHIAYCFSLTPSHALQYTSYSWTAHNQYTICNWTCEYFQFLLCIMWHLCKNRRNSEPHWNQVLHKVSQPHCIDSLSSAALHNTPHVHLYS
jgi:hypothetical protein